MEEDASEVAALQKKIRELEAKISELEEDLENEKMARSRVCMEERCLLIEVIGFEYSQIIYFSIVHNFKTVVAKLQT